MAAVNGRLHLALTDGTVVYFDRGDDATGVRTPIAHAIDWASLPKYAERTVSRT